ncbi:MAG: ferritin [Candidatus Bathyarchaeota archaeon]
MKLDKKLEDVLNKQVNEELYAWYLYLSAAMYFESKNFKGFAAWMGQHASEEMSHAKKIMDYINERGGNVILKQISEPKTEWKSILEVFEDAYTHELEVTKMFYKLNAVADSEKDITTKVFLQWFLTEQVEEEEITNELVEKVKMAGNNMSILLMLDAKIGEKK